MTTVEETYLYSGLQNGRVYLLNTKGRPKATNTVAYTGHGIYASKSYNPTLPSSRRVPHPGNDRLLKTQLFPGQDPASAELSVGSEDLGLIAMISGTTIKEIAGMKLLPHLHDLQGKEKAVGIILWQAAVSRQASTPGYRTHIITSSKMVARLNGAGNDPIDFVYDVSINPSEKYLWGASLAPLADIYDEFSGVPDMGVFEAGVLSGFSTTTPRIASFISGASTTVFAFPVNEKAANVDDIAVFTASAADEESELVDPADYTAAVTGITFDVTPGLNKEVHVVYQVTE